MKEKNKFFEYDVPGFLKDNRILSTNALSFLEIVLEEGGYVSGGFAKLVGNVITETLPYVFSGNLKKRLRDYLGHYSRSQGEQKNHGDIDCYFHSEEDHDRALESIATSGTWLHHEPSGGGFGRDFYVSGTRMQLVRGLVGSPARVTETFDLANAKVYFDSKGFYCSKEWIDLEERKILGIDQCENSNLVWRTLKWFKKHGYTRLRDGDDKKLVNSLENLLETSGEVSREELKGIASKLIDALTVPEEILRLSMYSGGYEMMRTFRRLNEGTNP